MFTGQHRPPAGTAKTQAGPGIGWAFDRLGSHWLTGSLPQGSRSRPPRRANPKRAGGGSTGQASDISCQGRTSAGGFVYSAGRVQGNRDLKEGPLDRSKQLPLSRLHLEETRPNRPWRTGRVTASQRRLSLFLFSSFACSSATAVLATSICFVWIWPASHTTHDQPSHSHFLAPDLQCRASHHIGSRRRPSLPTKQHSPAFDSRQSSMS